MIERRLLPVLTSGVAALVVLAVAACAAVTAPRPAAGHVTFARGECLTDPGGSARAGT